MLDGSWTCDLSISEILVCPCVCPPAVFHFHSSWTRWWIFLHENKHVTKITVHSVRLIQFRVFELWAPPRSMWQFNPRGISPVLVFLRAPAAAAGWLHCISSHTKNQHGAHPEYGEYGGINLDGKLLSVGLIGGRSRKEERTCVGLATLRMRSGLGCFRCGRVSRSVMAEVQWIAGLPSSLLCWMSWGVRCHCSLVLQIF